MVKGLQVTTGSATQVHKLLDDGRVILGADLAADVDVSGSLVITGSTGTSGSLDLLTKELLIASVTGAIGQVPRAQADGTVEWETISTSLSASDVPLGSATDGSLTDGLLPFTGSTLTVDAIDDINEVLLAISPAAPDLLTGTDLQISTTNVKLPSGLIAGDWYVGAAAAGSTVEASTDDTPTLTTADPSTRFKVGFASELTASTLAGGITASVSEGSDAFAVVGTRDYNSGTGNNDEIDLTSLEQYNSIWAKANASIVITGSVPTGSNRYQLSASTGLDTNVKQVFYPGSGGTFPAQSFSTAPSSIATTEVTDFLSGIEYYDAGTIFNVNFEAGDLYTPIYTTGNEATIDTVSATEAASQDFFTSTTKNAAGTPADSDTLSASEGGALDVTLVAERQSVFGDLGSGSVALAKPFKSNVTTNFALGSKPINSEGIDSTNNSNSQTEPFVDEENRATDLQADSGSFASGSALTDGNLQVQNGRLIVGEFGAYPSLTSGSSTNAATYANYFRISKPSSINRQLGTITIARNASAFGIGAANPIAPWGSGTGELEMGFVLEGDVTGPETTSRFFDLGRNVGINADVGGFSVSGAISSVDTSTTTSTVISWTLSAGNNTGTGSVYVWTRYNDSEAVDYITQIDLTYTT